MPRMKEDFLKKKWIPVYNWFGSGMTRIHARLMQAVTVIPQSRFKEDTTMRV
jgi:hypothetical protein